MNNQTSLWLRLPAALIFFSAAISICAQDQSGGGKHNVRPQQAVPVPTADPEPKTEAVKYSYEFSQPKFIVSRIVLEHDANGRGTVTFERLNENIPVVEPLELSTAALERIRSSWQALRFLESETNYQSDKQFPHLGTMRIGIQRGDSKRVAEFNWTNNSHVSTLVGEYRKAADQVILVFDISVARENQPLGVPKLMEAMESLLKRNGLSDPSQLLKLLDDLSTDEHVPLMARNHATRLIKKIRK